MMNVDFHSPRNDPHHRRLLLSYLFASTVYCPGLLQSNNYLFSQKLTRDNDGWMLAYFYVIY